VGYNRNRSKLSVKRWTRFQINRDPICCILLIIPALSAHSFAGDGENLKRFIYKNGGPVLDTGPPFFIVTRKEVIKNLCHLCTGGLVCRIQFSVASGYNAAFYKGSLAFTLMAFSSPSCFVKHTEYHEAAEIAIPYSFRRIPEPDGAG
jgi:hypothetical protein